MVSYRNVLLGIPLNGEPQSIKLIPPVVGKEDEATDENLYWEDTNIEEVSDDREERDKEQ